MMKSTPKIPLTFLTLVAGLFISQAHVQATLLVYEGFDYTGGANLVGQSGGTGWDANWVAGTGDDPEYFKITISGLEFGSNFLVSGNAVQSSTTGSGTDFRTVLRNAFDATPAAGDLWQSYLYQPTTNGALATAGGLRLRLQPNLEGHLRTWAKRGTGGVARVGFTDNNEAGTTGALALNTTYLLLTQYTNLGTGDTVIKTANLWVFDLDDFNDWHAAGRNETGVNGLGAFATLSASQDQNGLTRTLNIGDELGLVEQWNNAGIWDELRLGTSMESVLPIPEPGTLVLVGIGLGLAALTCRRRR